MILNKKIPLMTNLRITFIAPIYTLNSIQVSGMEIAFSDNVPPKDGYKNCIIFFKIFIHFFHDVHCVNFLVHENSIFVLFQCETYRLISTNSYYILDLVQFWRKPLDINGFKKLIILV